MGGFIVYETTAMGELLRKQEQRIPDDYWAWSEEELRNLESDPDADLSAEVLLPDEQWSVNDLTFSPDGNYLLTCGFGTYPLESAGNSIRRWEIRRGPSGQVSVSDAADSLFVTDPRHVSRLAFSDGGSFLAYATEDGDVVVLEYPAGKKLFDCKCMDGGIERLLFFRGDSMLAVAGRNGSIQLLDCAPFKLRSLLTGHRGPVYALAYDPRRDILYSGGADATIFAWDVKNA